MPNREILRLPPAGICTQQWWCHQYLCPSLLPRSSPRVGAQQPQCGGPGGHTVHTGTRQECHLTVGSREEHPAPGPGVHLPPVLLHPTARRPSLGCVGVLVGILRFPPRAFEPCTCGGDSASVITLFWRVAAAVRGIRLTHCVGIKELSRNFVGPKSS